MDHNPNLAPPGAADTAEERTASHLACCRELLDMAMQLTRDAAENAKAAWQAAKAGTEKPARKTPDPALVFARLARIVQTTIALEARLLAGPRTRSADETPRPAASNDPRRETLIRVLEDATRHHPDRKALHKGIADRVDYDLSLDPAYEFPADNILCAISDDLGITIEYGKLSDATLKALCAARAETPDQHEAGNPLRALQPYPSQPYPSLMNALNLSTGPP